MMRRVAGQVEFVPSHCVPKLPPCTPRLAEAYVPYQVYGATFSPPQALCTGTVFPELYKPYVVGAAPGVMPPCR
ncbi:MAG: spore coat associated protein CotJA [Firmicutes bacterium]|jgi:hypothetical protein|nr:spore coat associated protein CotJA [Bacillota bacterium]